MQPIFENNATSTINIIIWLEKQIKNGEPFSLKYRDSSFEEYNGKIYTDHGITMIKALRDWTIERGVLENWLVADGGNNYGDIGDIYFTPRKEELAKTRPFVGTWPSKWW